MVDSIMEELIYSCRCLDAGIAEVIQRMDQMGVTLKKRGLSEEFIMLYQDFHNNTRMQANRGYSPNELLSFYPPEKQVPQSISLGPNIRKGIADGSIRVSDLRQQILSAQLPNEALRRGLLKELAEIQPPRAIKIGRNELCPCGSGKKYKKCCGR
ncbi:MAG: SEC-C domain-containing protein [Streptococcus parasanguinis]|nr:SEC-C domain-containing protein [Streptococcus parasanguinis]